MVNINISIKKEAYDFLRSLKTMDKSFSDVILSFRRKKGNKDRLMKFYGILKDKDIDWGAREENMMRFRTSFDESIRKTIKKMEQSRK